MSERSPQDQDKYVVRFPDGMRDRIRAAAEENKRSMNAEIISRLEETFQFNRVEQAHEMLAEAERRRDESNAELAEMRLLLRAFTQIMSDPEAKAMLSYYRQKAEKVDD